MEGGQNITAKMRDEDGLKMDDAGRQRYRRLLRTANTIRRWADAEGDLELREQLLKVATELALIAELPEPHRPREGLGTARSCR